MTETQSPQAAAGRSVDGESQRWLTVLRDGSPQREQGIAELHSLLLRAARAELHRRSDRVRVAGPEINDLAHQAAADALLAILGKLGQFRGESRFTTWAYRFVILEVSTKLGRHFWRTPAIAVEAEDWERLPERFGLDPQQHSEARDLIGALQRAVEQDLTSHQREAFVAIVVHGIPLDALVAQLGSSRGAIYKTMFDARGKLRAALAANGYLHNTDEQTPSQAGARRARSATSPLSCRSADQRSRSICNCSNRSASSATTPRAPDASTTSSPRLSRSSLPTSRPSGLDR